MKTVDFKAELSPDDEEIGWRAAGRERFEAAYSADDSIYEQLVHDAPV